MSVFDPEYLVPVSEDPPSTSQAADRVRWEGIKPELAPGEVYSVTAHLRALAPCQDTVVGNLMLPYYFTGLGTGAEYTVRGAVYLPLVLRSAG